MGSGPGKVTHLFLRIKSEKYLDEVIVLWNPLLDFWLCRTSKVNVKSKNFKGLEEYKVGDFFFTEMELIGLLGYD